MKVEEARSTAANFLKMEPPRGKSQPIKETAKDQGQNIEVPQTGTTPPQEGNFVATNVENERGVIRLLQDGHFKGVADVRLRINFYDELNSIEHQNLQTVVENGVQNILETVGESIDSFLSSDASPEEISKSINDLEGGFVDAINRSKEDFLISNGSSKETFLTGINSAFETFVLSLGSTLATNPAEASEDDLPSGDHNMGEPLPLDVADLGNDRYSELAPTQELQPFSQDFIDKLRSTFTGALEGLSENIIEIKVLPELSSSKGNGFAYDKFLTIYNNMVGNETSATNVSGALPVDTIA
jgi:hypothetical protein